MKNNIIITFILIVLLASCSWEGGSNLKISNENGITIGLENASNFSLKMNDMKKAMNSLEKKYNEKIKNNPSIKKSINQINNYIAETKELLKNGKTSKEILEKVTKIKKDIDKIKESLEKK